MHQVHLSALDLNLLVALDALLDESSVGRAALRISRSQPAMSRTLGRLRDMFADPLLVQQGRRLVRTARANELRGPLKRLLSDVGLLLAPLPPFDPATARRRFTLLSSDYAQVVLLGPVLEALGPLGPGLTFTVAAAGADPLQLLAAGAADLLLGSPAAPSWCASQSLLRDEWACVWRRGARGPRSLTEYLARDHIDVALERDFGSPIAQALGRQAKHRRARACVQDFAGALFVVAQSHLVATVPKPVALRAAQLLPLRMGPTPFALAPSEVAMVWPQRQSSDPAHLWLRSAVISAVQASTESLPTGGGRRAMKKRSDQ